MSIAQLDIVLDATADIVVNDGVDCVTLGTIAHHSGSSPDAVLGVIGSVEHALLLTLQRERLRMRTTIHDNIERDPRGGLLSRIFYYSLCAIYERPLMRALYLTDPGALSRLLRTVQGFELEAPITAQAEFVQQLIEAGMVRDDADPSVVAGLLGTFAAGLAITTPHADFDLIVKSIELVIVELFDAAPRSTDPGKDIFGRWSNPAQQHSAVDDEL